MKKILTLLLIITVTVGFAACSRGDEPAAATTQSTTAASVSAAPETTETAEQTTEATTTEPESTTAPATTDAADRFPFLKQGYWYLFDEENHCAYAFAFGNGGKAEMAFFNAYNVDGDDARYLTADCSYTVSDNAVQVTDLPRQTERERLEIIINGDRLLYRDRELEQHEDLTLEYPFQHFNVQAMPYSDGAEEFITGVTNG